MAYRAVFRMAIPEIIRRWPAGAGRWQIGRAAEGIAQDGPVATEEQLSRLAGIGQSGPRQAETPTEDVLLPWADQIYQWIANDRLQMTRILELLLARGCELSYQSLRRFVLKRNWRRLSKTTVRMEDTPLERRPRPTSAAWV